MTFCIAFALQAPDGELMQRRAGENGFGSGRSPSSSESGSRGLNMRPSMEARRRRLGLSALQVHCFTLIQAVSILLVCIGLSKGTAHASYWFGDMCIQQSTAPAFDCYSASSLLPIVAPCLVACACTWPDAAHASLATSRYRTMVISHTQHHNAMFVANTEHKLLPLHAVRCHGVVHLLVYIGSMLGKSIHVCVCTCTLVYSTIYSSI